MYIITGGTPFNFLNVEGEFDYTDLGCDNNFEYLCLELAKGSEAQPDFKFQVFTFQETLIICDQVTCDQRSPGKQSHASPSMFLFKDRV